MKLTIGLIWAQSENGVIGSNNKLPWNVPEDMARFRELTRNKVVVMGRKTYESIGQPLPMRTNIVVTRSNDFLNEGVVVRNDLDAALNKARELTTLFISSTSTHKPEVVVIGGSEIYKQCLPVADKLYITYISGEHEGDAYAPEWDRDDFVQTEYVVHDKCIFTTYERKRLTVIEKLVKVLSGLTKRK